MKHLQTDGVLSIAGPTGFFVLSGAGSTLVLSTASLSALARSARLAARRRGGRFEVAGRLDAGLRRAGLALDINVGRRTVARVGAGARASRLARWSGWGPVQMKWFALAAAVVTAGGSSRAAARGQA